MPLYNVIQPHFFTCILQVHLSVTTFTTLLSVNQVDLSASKLARIEAKLKRAVGDLEQVEKSLNVDQLKEEMKRDIDKRNR